MDTRAYTHVRPPRVHTHTHTHRYTQGRTPTHTQQTHLEATGVDKWQVLGQGLGTPEMQVIAELGVAWTPGNLPIPGSS